MINKCIIAGLLCFFGFNSCSDNKNNSSAENSAVTPKSIYTTKCQLCHGADGKLGLNGAFDLSTSPLSLPERIEVITNGRNSMTPFVGILSEKEIKAVAEYTMTLGKK